jgi:hypothetical protein
MINVTAHCLTFPLLLCHYHSSGTEVMINVTAHCLTFPLLLCHYYSSSTEVMINVTVQFDISFPI